MDSMESHSSSREIVSTVDEPVATCKLLSFRRHQHPQMDLARHFAPNMRHGTLQKESVTLTIAAREPEIKMNVGLESNSCACVGVPREGEPESLYFLASLPAAA